MNYYLLKSEGGCYGIDDLRKDKKTSWTGIRNYQARNLMKEMEVGDLCLFYHSSGRAECPTGVYGVAKVVTKAYPEREKPWECVDVKFVEKFKNPVLLSYMKLDPNLKGIDVLRIGNRLSVQRVSEKHFDHIVKLGKK